jgi:hypothetical protein
MHSPLDQQLRGPYVFVQWESSLKGFDQVVLIVYITYIRRTRARDLEHFDIDVNRLISDGVFCM